MKFDTIIIGGGLAGLTAGIALTKAGVKTAIISSGQSAMHFSSGSFELLNSICGADVSHPFDQIANLPSTHPYSKIGVEKIKRYAAQVAPMLKEAGTSLKGELETNHWRLTPFGAFSRAWLTFDDCVAVADCNNLPWKRLTLVTFPGFLDFYHRFLETALKAKGVETKTEYIDFSKLGLPEVGAAQLRTSTIERLLTGPVVSKLARQINHLAEGAEAVLMPAVIGLRNPGDLARLRKICKPEVMFMPSVPTSLPGIRAQRALQKSFRHLGGTFILGDTVEPCDSKGTRIDAIHTIKQVDTRLEADHYVLASGSFCSNGLRSNPDCIYEPIFGLDVEAPQSRAKWFAQPFFDQQPYMSFGVATDSALRGMRNGKPVENLYVIGSLLSGCDPLAEGCGAGVALMTAFAVAEEISKGYNKK